MRRQTQNYVITGRIGSSKEDWGKANPTKLLFKLGKYVGKNHLDELYWKVVSLSKRRDVDSNNALGYLFNEFVSIPSLSKAKNYGLQKDITTKVDMFFINFLALTGIEKFSIQSIEWMDFSIVKELKVENSEHIDPLKTE